MVELVTAGRSCVITTRSCGDVGDVMSDTLQDLMVTPTDEIYLIYYNL